MINFVNAIKKVSNKRFPLRGLLQDDKYHGDVIFIYGGLISSSITATMHDTSTGIIRQEKIIYDEYRVITRPFPWLRLLLPSVEGLPYKKGTSADYCEMKVDYDKDVRLVIFQCSIFANTPEKIIDKEISIYKKNNNLKNDTCFVLINHSEETPWRKVLLTNVIELFNVIND